MTNDGFVKFLETLQHKIEYEEEQYYSKTVIYEYRNPSNFGVFNKPDLIGDIKGPCGDTMNIGLKLKNRKIIDARFWTDGCGATIACGSMLTKMIIGKTIKEASRITRNNLTKALNGLPEEHLHCSKLAVKTLQKAIKSLV
jgi:nitrogen fixation NifU-like protein